MEKNIVQIDMGKATNSCFVVMPFNDLFQTEYEKVIQPALNELNITCIRGDEIYTKPRIVDDIWESLRACRFVIAELNSKNPNVLYEVGLAHAIAKPVIILTRNEDDVPFDLKALRYLYYDVHDPSWGENLKAGIQALVKKVLANPDSDKYLDGITKTNSVIYPKNIKSASTSKSVVKKIAGIWKGKFNLHAVHNISIDITQKDSEITGVAEISFKDNKINTIVQEIMSGSIKKNSIRLTGVNYTYLNRGNSEEYGLDAFELQYKRSNLLEGVVYNIDDPTVKVPFSLIK